MAKKISAKLAARRTQAKSSQQLSIASTRKLFATLFGTLKARKKLFGGIFAVQFLLLLIFVWSAGSTTDINELKTTVNDALGAQNSLVSNVTVTGLLFASFGSVSSEIAGVYQSLILLICSLTYIWVFRHVHEKSLPRITLRTAFYKSTAQLIPFLGVILVVGLQLLPLTVGLGILSASQTGSVVVTTVEQVIIGVLVLLVLFGTFYFVSASVFALFIVTLPDALPIGALRSARSLVRFRRWAIMRRLLLGGLLLLLGGGLLLLAVVSLVPGLTNFILFLYSSLILPLVIGYMYTLYKELL